MKNTRAIYSRVLSAMLSAAAVVTAIIVLLSVAGDGDLVEAQRQQQEYCVNVHAGYWPDYNHNYWELCDESGNAK